MIFGGTVDELGLRTIGIAQSVDVGNFGTEETAIVLLDLLSEESGDPNSLNSFLLLESQAKLPLVASTLANIGAHEAGHLLANFHTERDEGPVTLMDRGGRVDLFAGVGEDGRFGTADDEDLDFGPDNYSPAEAFEGTEDTLDAISFGLPAGGPVGRLAARPSAWDFGALAVGSEALRSFVLSNEGNQTVTLGAPRLSGPGVAAFELIGEPSTPPSPPPPTPAPPTTGSEPRPEDGLPLTGLRGAGLFREADLASSRASSGGGEPLPPAASRTYTVRFSPTSLGSRTAVLEIPSDDPRRPLIRIDLLGQGGVPAFRLDSAGHDFGIVEYGFGPQILSHDFTVFNDGPGELLLDQLLLFGSGASQFAGSLPAGGTIPPGGSLTLEASFSPLGPVGPLRAVLAVRSNDPVQPRQDLELLGVANGPDVSISPFPIFAYGRVRVATPRDRIFRVFNQGNRDLTVSTLEIDGDNALEFTLGDGGIPFTLAPEGEWQLVVTFTPADLGVRSAVLRLHNNDPDESPLEVELLGVGSVPDISVDPPIRHFGPVPLSGSLSRRIQVINSGGSTLSVSGTEILGPHASDFSIATGGAPFTVSPESFARMRLRFEPSAEGLRTAFLRITSDDPDSPVLDVPLDGTGVADLSRITGGTP